MFTIFREYCLLPEKQIWSHCSFMHTFEERVLPTVTDEKKMILIFWRNPTELRLIFTLNFIYQFITITDKIFYNRHIYRYMQMQQSEKVHLYMTVLTLLIEQFSYLMSCFK